MRSNNLKDALILLFIFSVWIVQPLRSFTNDNPSLQLVIKDFQVTNEDLKGDEPCTRIAASHNTFIVVWEVYSKPLYDSYEDCDIYAQLYANDGLKIGDTFQVNDDTGEKMQRSPAVAMSDSGDFIITWNDRRNSRGDYSELYAQKYDDTGAPVGSNFLVSDSGLAAGTETPQICIDNSGYFIVTWRDSRNNDHGDIYAQRFSADLEKIGSNFQVNDDSTDNEQQYPAICLDNNGICTITWADGRNDGIYAQRYDSDGKTIGTNFQVDNTGTDISTNLPDIDCDQTGRFIIIWEDERNGHPDIYAQYFDINGEKTGDNFQVNNYSRNDSENGPEIGVNQTGEFIVTWDDYINSEYDIYAQLYDTNITAIGDTFRINTDTTGSEQANHSTVFVNNFVYTCWLDHQTDPKSIWANVYKYVADSKIIPTLPHNFNIYPIYPNPFNATTNIRFDVPEETLVEIIVYDLMGREVWKSAKTNYNAGTYSMTWNGVTRSGRPVGTGMYFVKMNSTKYTATQKILLLK